MISFGGVVCHDGKAVSESWMRRLIGTGRVSRLVYDRAAAFVEYEQGQPFVGDPSSADRSCARNEPIFLVDARIDNSPQLVEQGILPTRDNNDAEVVTLAYERWGESCVKHLVGDFAFARWDPVQRQLCLARDALGVRPIYFYASPTLFAFATDLPALLALPFVPRILREDTIADFLNRVDSTNPGETFYDAIHRLPAAHCLHLNGNQYRQTCYWKPDAVPPCSPMGDDAYANQLRERIVTAVECRLRDAKTAAVHLSGGIDSASIACIAARYLKRRGGRLLALCSMLSANHDGPEVDEREFVQAVLAQEDNIDVIWIEVPMEHDVFAASDTWFDTLGQPFFSTVSHIEEMLAKAGRTHGVDVVLSGFGGDFFASVPARDAVRQMVRTGRWRMAASELRAIHKEQGVSWKSLLKREVLVPLLPAPVRRVWRAARSSSRESMSCVLADFAQRIDKRRGRRLPASEKLASASTHELMRFIARPGHIEQPLANTVQVFAQRFAQSLRFPLLDLRIVQFMLSVPIEQLQKDGWQRSLMRRAMQGILPEAIRVRRDKGGAFDPAIMSRIVHCRDALTEWVTVDSNRACWKYIDRDRYLTALANVRPASRAQWRQDTFQVVILGGLMARFIDWHQSNLQGGI
ncbi:MAG: asparagine synthase-related protein [Pseudomonadota bacterium]